MDVVWYSQEDTFSDPTQRLPNTAIKARSGNNCKSDKLSFNCISYFLNHLPQYTTSHRDGTIDWSPTSQKGRLFNNNYIKRMQFKDCY